MENSRFSFTWIPKFHPLFFSIQLDSSDFLAFLKVKAVNKYLFSLKLFVPSGTTQLHHLMLNKPHLLGVHKKIDPFVFPQFLHQILLKFQNQGQFWNLYVLNFPKLSLILKFEQDLIEKLRKNKRVNFFMDTLYMLFYMLFYRLLCRLFYRIFYRIFYYYYYY